MKRRKSTLLGYGMPKYGDLAAIARALSLSVPHVSRLVYGERPWTPGALEKALAALVVANEQRARIVAERALRLSLLPQKKTRGKYAKKIKASTETADSRTSAGKKTQAKKAA